MADEETADNASEVSADEDWKAQVKAEDAALDEKLAQEAAEKKAETEEEPQAAETPAPEEQEPPADAETATEPEMPQEFPPAEFSIVVSMFSTQAMVALGVIPNPATGKAEVHIELARRLIDMITVLEEKTKGNLDKDEADMLDSTLHHLRMTFLQKSKKS